jgi:hypothetical protein
VICSLQGFPNKTVSAFLTYHACHLPRSSQSSWFHKVTTQCRLNSRPLNNKSPHCVLFSKFLLPAPLRCHRTQRVLMKHFKISYVCCELIVYLLCLPYNTQNFSMHGQFNGGRRFKRTYDLVIAKRVSAVILTPYHRGGDISRPVIPAHNTKSTCSSVKLQCWNLLGTITPCSTSRTPSLSLSTLTLSLSVFWTGNTSWVLF